MKRLSSAARQEDCLWSWALSDHYLDGALLIKRNLIPKMRLALSTFYCISTWDTSLTGRWSDAFCHDKFFFLRLYHRRAAVFLLLKALALCLVFLEFPMCLCVTFSWCGLSHPLSYFLLPNYNNVVSPCL